MTANQTDSSVPDDVTGNIGTAPFSVGIVLREARVHQGLSVDEVCGRIKFAPRQIEALEADDFAHLPEPAFLRGFVRSYARLLQLDPAPLLAALPHPPEQSAPMEAQALTEIPYPDTGTERRQNIIWLAGAFVVVIALALAAWMLGDKPKEQTVPEVNASGAHLATVETLALPEVLQISAVPDAEPVTRGLEKSGAQKTIAEKPVAENIIPEKKKSAEIKSVPQISPPPARPITLPPAEQAVRPAAASIPSEQSVIRLKFDADSWVEISDRNGKRLLSQLNHAGTELGVNGNAPFTLLIGNAKTVHLYYKRQAVDLTPHINIEVARLTLE